MFAKTVIATAALAATVSAQGMSSCWSECFAKYQISSEGQLCCTETGPIVSSCISVGCPTANATAYEAWLGEYCWTNEGGSTSATSNTWTAPPKTSTIFSTSEVTITSCKPEVTDCPNKPESSTEVITTTTEIAVSTTEICPYGNPTPSNTPSKTPGGYPPKSSSSGWTPEHPGNPPVGPTSSSSFSPVHPGNPPVGPTSSSVGGGVGGGCPGCPSGPYGPTSYPAGNSTTATASGTGQYTPPPQQTGNSAANVQIGGVVMLLGAAAALL